MSLVERAFTTHLSGGYIDSPLFIFSHDNYWKPLQVFSGNLVSERRWSCVLDEDTDEDLRTDQSMISAYRAEIYVPYSSLTKV